MKKNFDLTRDVFYVCGIKNKDVFIYYFIAPTVMVAARLFFNYVYKVLKPSAAEGFGDYHFVKIATISNGVVIPVSEGDKNA